MLRLWSYQWQIYSTRFSTISNKENYFSPLTFSRSSSFKRILAFLFASAACWSLAFTIVSTHWWHFFNSSYSGKWNYINIGTHKQANKTWADKYTKVQGLKPQITEYSLNQIKLSFESSLWLKNQNKVPFSKKFVFLENFLIRLIV